MNRITLGCGTVITLDDLETAGISFVPCGQVDGKDQPLIKHAHLLKARKQVTRQSYGKKWYGYGMRNANGVQLMTGFPTYRPAPDNLFYYYTSLDIEKRMREEHPALVNEVVKIYREGITGTPCEIETKSGGLRLDTYSLYLGKKIPFADDEGMLFEILAGGALVRLDARYRMRHGSVLELPIMESNAPLQEIHKIASSIATKVVSSQSERKVVSTSQLGEIDIEWSEVTIEKDDGPVTVHVSQYFPTEHCPNHHESNRLEVRFTKYPSGAIDGICWNCGENWWEVEPPKRNQRQKPVRLTKKNDVSLVAEALEKSRKFLSEAFGKGKGFIGLRSDTGTGKDHHAILHFQQTATRGFYSVPTTEHAIETAGRMDKAELSNVFRWRGLHSHPDGMFPHEKPCIQPDLYEAYLLRGRNAYELVCQRCPNLNECTEFGFRSQVDKAKKSQVIVASHHDLLFNPIYRSMAKQLLPNNREDTLVVNEFDVFTRYLDIAVGQARLEYLSKTWYDHSLGTFAQLILKACLFESNPIAAIKTIIDNITPTERNNISLALTQYRIGDTILSKDEAQDLEKRSSPKNISEVLALPLIEIDDWNLLGQLEIFFEQYPDPDRAPMRWEKNTLSFAMPPLPMHTKSRVICMSATLEKETFLHTFKHRQEKRGDVLFLDGNDTAWHPDAGVFQLRTNGNPRKTLLIAEQDADGNWIYTGELTTTGKNYMEMILNSLSKMGGTQAFISHKPIVDAYRDELAKIGVKVGWFGGLAGLDAHFDRDKNDGIILHILGTPELPPHETEYRSKLLGITEEKVHDGSVKSETMQSIGRAGLVKNPSIVVLWTSIELPSVTQREQTLLFDETDFARADGDLNQLPSVITKREQSEASGDVEKIMEATGVSERTAYRRRKKPSKTERNAEIIRRAKTETHAQIATALGISEKTVQRTLKKA